MAGGNATYNRPATTPVTLTGQGAVGVSYELDGTSQTTILDAPIDMPPISIALLPEDNADLPAVARRAIVPGSVLFSWNSKLYFDRSGTLYKDLDPATGAGTIAGTIDYTAGNAYIIGWGAGAASLPAPVILGCATRQAFIATSFVRFRCPGAPIRPQSLIVRATGIDGELYTGNSQADGSITGTRVAGEIDYETGIVAVQFGEELNDNDSAPDLTHRAEEWYTSTARYDVSETATPDWRVWRPVPVDPTSVLFNVVIYTALPLDADLIGIDPVRLPSDGKVPVFAKGYVIVIHDTMFQTMPSGLVASQVVSMGRTALAEVILRDQNGQVVPGDRYTVQKTAGTVTMANPLNLAGYVEPLIAEHRIEDMALCTDAQISGDLALSRALVHDYTAANSYVSSALLFGDLQARLHTMFSQQTWTSLWQDTRIGADTTASYNDVAFPPVVTNDGAITERWALIFTSQTAFNIVGENVGVIGTGITSADCSPINPVTAKPYFTLDADGWGVGWSTGNVLRFNTAGAQAPIWFARTTKQSAEEGVDDDFRVQMRGDAD